MSSESLSEIAKSFVAAGISVLPIRADGSKSPALDRWEELQNRTLSEEEIDECFKPGLGIAVIGGEISGNLEFLDFDVPKDSEGNEVGSCVFDEWVDCLDAELFELVESMPVVETPSGGRHVYYRCEKLEGNRKLAMKLNGPGVFPAKSTVVETRGRGGYVLAPGCPAACHPTGKLYRFVTGSFESIPTITPGQRGQLIAAARSFDESGLAEKEERRAPSAHVSNGNRPGDDYNRRADWEGLLEAHGWTFAYRRRIDGASCWRRPGKPPRERGISATVRDIDGMELFHSFSSNCDPLPHDESITKFTAYTLFYHNGDYESAARELGKLGYGDQARASRIADIDSIVDGKRDDSVPWCDDTIPVSDTRVIYLFGEESSAEDNERPDFAEVEESPYDASIFHEEVDPLDVQIFEDETKLKAEQARRDNEEKLRRRQLAMARGPGYIVWTDFGDPPKRSLTAEGRIKTSADKPRDTMWEMLHDRFSDSNGLRTIHFHNGSFVRWEDGRYRAFSPDEIRPSIATYLSHFAEFKSEDGDGNKIYEPFKIRVNRTVEMVKTMQDMVHIDRDTTYPCWLATPDGMEELPDPREVVCCKNGLLDIVKKEIIPPTPAFYSFNNTGIDYDPDAAEPTKWLEFLDSSLDKESQKLLQQWFGYCLVQDTRLHKMLMIVGKSGSGKGTAISVLKRLVGESSCCAMSFENFDSNFGLQNAIGKSLMIFPDARQNAKFDVKGSAVSQILKITGEDDVQIDRKFCDPLTVKLNTRLVIVSNDIMQLTDRSKALSRRMLWIKFPGHTAPKADPNLKDKFIGELSGILNWAIEGWEMVRYGGGFIEPKSSEMIRSAFEEQSSDISSFIEDMCLVGPEQECKKVDFVTHWNAWRISKGYKKMGEATAGKLLASAVMGLSASRKRNTAPAKGRSLWYRGISIERDKVDEYAQEYGGSAAWSELIRSVGGTGDEYGDGVVGIQEWIDSKGSKK